MAPSTCTTVRHQHRLRLTREPTAAAEARSQVRAVIRAWKVPVDPDIAVLLTSDLVTDAITYGDGETVMLVLEYSRRHLLVEVSGTPRLRPMAVEEPAVARRRPGLTLVAAHSTEWGSFRTQAGETVYFTLAFAPDLSWADDHVAAGDT
ncbi:MAG: ATP-binding protein [Acidimicrobiales bacterium]